MNKEKLRIYLIDDSPMVRKTLALLINHEPDLEVSGEAASAGQALAKIGSMRADVVILDVSLPDMDGMELIRKIKSSHPAMRILVVSMHDGWTYVESALNAGAKGYIAKDKAAEDVIPAIHHIAQGGIYLSEYSRADCKIPAKGKAKNKRVFAFLVCLSSLALWLKPACALAKLSLNLSPESILWLKGDSTLHVYTSTATVLNASIGLDETEPAEPRVESVIKLKMIAKLNVTIPVAGLKSGKSALDKKMYEALKSGQYPDIHFEMVNYEIQNTNKNILSIQAKGTLRVAGKVKDCLLDLKASYTDDALEIEGSEELLMTDFGIEPPQMMLGAIKTDDKVVIHYWLRFKLLNEK